MQPLSSTEHKRASVANPSAKLGSIRRLTVGIRRRVQGVLSDGLACCLIPRDREVVHSGRPALPIFSRQRPPVLHMPQVCRSSSRTQLCGGTDCRSLLNRRLLRFIPKPSGLRCTMHWTDCSSCTILRNETSANRSGTERLVD